MATIINRRGAEFAETWNSSYYSTWKRIAYLLLSNRRLRSFVLRALCDSVVLICIQHFLALRWIMRMGPAEIIASVPLRLCGWVSASQFTTKAQKT